ncbi:MAG: hypothetical protein JRJ02_15380, partial [Deltaproteobacteria bacterium]|nr:hypothetical protein [Deltaproteobacteria bacterium]
MPASQSKLCQFRPQISTLILSQDTEGETNQRPQMDRLVAAIKVVIEIVDLGMAVMARGDAILSPCI